MNIQKYQYKKIINFLKPKGNKYRRLIDIDIFLNLELSVHILYKWDLDNTNIRKVYSNDIHKLYSNHRVFVYFPNDNIRIDMPINRAEKLPVIKNFLENQFSEKSIKIRYYHLILKRIMDGPLIIVITLPIDSIILENGITLLSKIID